MAGNRRRVERPTIRFLYIPLLVILFSVTAAEKGRGTAYASTSGRIDLRRWDFEADRIASLAGSWEIYWGALLTPQHFDAPSGQTGSREPDGVFEMPGIWNDWPSGEEGVGGIGFATFHTVVILPEGMTRGALRVQPASTAYRLWANGRLIAVSGVPGRTASETTPAYRVVTALFEAPQNTLELVLQISNFHHRRGGMWRPIELGTIELIESKESLEVAYDLLLIGSFLGLALYNLLVFRTAGGRRRAPFYLSLLFAVLALRIAMMGQMMVTRLFPGFPWTAQLRIEYLTAHFALLALTLTIKAIYPSVIGRRIAFSATALTAINTLSVLGLPVLLYSRVVGYYVYAMIAVLTLELVLLVTAFLRGHRASWAGIVAVGLTVLITLGETIHYQQFILSRDFAPFGFLITLIAGDSVNRATAYLASAAVNLLIVFLVANVLAVHGSRVLRLLENPGTALPSGEPNHSRSAAAVPAHPPPEIHNEGHDLTPREAEIARLEAEGLSNKEIAARLFVSEATVKTHVYRVMRKTDSGNRTELSRWYYAQGDRHG